MVYINEAISVKAMFFVEQYFLSHSMELTDALIGSTGMINIIKQWLAWELENSKLAT